MSSEPQHLKQARHNEAVTRLLTASRWAADWEVITLFYAAVHLVEAKAAESNVHSAGHAARVKFLHACYRAVLNGF